jgi:plasmid stability protein
MPRSSGESLMEARINLPRRAILQKISIDSNAINAYSPTMSTTLTIRSLDADVKQRLRVRAAMHGRSMEAEAREMLARALENPQVGPPAIPKKRPKIAAKSVCKSVRGLWKGQGTTDEIMKLTRGE